MNSYLIPSNTNRGKLILGLFRKQDLILFGIGISLTLILLMVLPMSSTLMTVIVLAPAAITALLVAPVPYYHNILTILIELLDFINNRQKFIWRGWCSKYGEENDK